MYYALGSFVAVMLLIFFYHRIFHIERKSGREMMLLVVLIAMTTILNIASIQVIPFQFGTAMVIITAVAFGPEAGFIVATMGRLLINFVQGQGPWTPWEMCAWGVLGILTGILFKKDKHNSLKSVIILSLWTFVSVFILYGGIMNLHTYLFEVRYTTNGALMDMLKSTYLAGIPYDLMHATRASLAVFLLANTLLKRLDRVKIKYGFYRVKSRRTY